jgi:hypothetical protein
MWAAIGTTHSNKEVPPVRFMLSMISDPSAWQKMTPEEAKSFEERLTALNEEIRNAGAWGSAEGVQEDARTVRFGKGTPSVRDGYALDGQEQFGGFWIVEAASLDEAVDWARKIPLNEGSVEVRPIFEG